MNWGIGCAYATQSLTMSAQCADEARGSRLVNKYGIFGVFLKGKASYHVSKYYRKPRRSDIAESADVEVATEAAVERVLMTFKKLVK